MRTYPARCATCCKLAVMPTTVRWIGVAKFGGKLYDVEVGELPIERCGMCGDVFFGNAADVEIEKALMAEVQKRASSG